MTRLTVAATLIITTLTLATAKPALAGDGPYYGEIVLFTGASAPKGWAFCEGQTLPIGPNQALFSLLTTTHGGDGTHNFKLPDLRTAEARLREDAGLKKDAPGPRYIIAIDTANLNVSPRSRGPYIGEIALFAGTFAPHGWAFCDGQTLPIAHNTALYAILAIYGGDRLGAIYGGDGKADFKLPDLRSTEARLREDAGLKKDAPGPRYIIAIDGVFPTRK